MLSYFIDGLFGGSIYALAALGIVLTYKTSGIFNFAYGGVAMLCAYSFWEMRDRWHWSQWLAIPLLIVVIAPVLGLVLERVFRPLTAAPVEIQIVVSLGILAFCEAVQPLLFPDHALPLPSVFSRGHFRIIGTTTYATWNEVGTLLVAFVLAGILYVILRRTRLGTATRAVIDNRDLAGLLGVNSGRVAQVAWVMSTVFAAISGVLLSTQANLTSYELPALVIYAFAPAVLGRLTSLPLAFGGAMGLGVIINILQRYSSSGFLARLESSLPYIALFVLLVAYGKRLTEVRSSLRPISGATVFGHNHFRFSYGVAGFVAAGFLIPHLIGAATQHDVAEAMAYAVVALTVVVLTGWTGQISIAQMTFAGVGAFTAAHIATTHGGLFPLAVLVGVLISVPLGVLVGLPSLRLSGLFLALATMAFALLMDNLVFGDNSISGGLTGLNLTTAAIGPVSFKSYTSQFYLCLVVLALACAGVYWLRQGPVGRRLQMVRDAPNAAATLGANLTLTKLAVFAACGGVAAVGGSLLAVTQQTVTPSNFAFNQSLQILLLVILGGRALVSGALLAGLLELVYLLPVPTFVHKYFPLLIAFSVIAIAKEPEGTLAVSIRQARYALAVLYRLPRPWLTAAPSTMDIDGGELSGRPGPLGSSLGLASAEGASRGG